MSTHIQSLQQDQYVGTFGCSLPVSCQIDHTRELNKPDGLPLTGKHDELFIAAKLVPCRLLIFWLKYHSKTVHLKIISKNGRFHWRIQELFYKGAQTGSAFGFVQKTLNDT